MPADNPQAISKLKKVASGKASGYAWVDIAIVGPQLTVDSALASQLIQRYPTLPLHACKSKTATTSTFGDHLLGALLPHACEHIAIEHMVQAAPGQTFAGNTRWISKSNQTMRVRLSCAKEETGIEPEDAISEAIALLNRLLAQP